MIIIINGASSSGKTSLARALQEVWSTKLLYLSLDQLMSQLPFSYTGEGLNAELGFPIRDNEVQVGPEGYKLNQIFCKSALQLQSFGYDLVIDYVFLDEQIFEPFKVLLKEAETLLVGLHCDVEVLNSRNDQRKDRIAGLSIKQASRVHFMDKYYDLELDSSNRESADLASSILSHIDRTGLK